MRKIFIGLILLVSFGCKHPADYIAATDKAYEIGPKADKNVETVCLNYYNHVSKNTAEFVASGKMTEETRQEILTKVKDQVVETRKQVLFLVTYLKLAHQDAHSSTLEIKNFTDVIKASNETIPEVKKLISQFK